MTTLVILRGLPGAGKTTLAMQMARQLHFKSVEADDFFYSFGVYNFDASKLGQAHTACFANTKQFLESGKSVVVSNTFTTEKEIKPYKELADSLGITFLSLVVENRHGNRSVHNVPGETLQKMGDRFSLSL